MKLVLKRIGIQKAGAFGVLSLETKEGLMPFCVTLEHTYPETGEKPKIPAGKYTCVKTRYIKGGYDTFEIMVPGHSRILFHKGNTEADSDGCVLLGELYTLFNKTPGIGSSGEGFKDFNSITSSEKSFELEVIDT